MSVRGRNKNIRWSGITLRGMAMAIGLCLILLMVVIAMSAKGSFGPSVNDNRVDPVNLDSQESVESPGDDLAPGHSALVSGDSAVVETLKEEFTSHESSNESGQPPLTGKANSELGQTGALPTAEAESNHPHAPALLVAHIDDIRIFADPDSDRLYLRGTIKSRSVGLIDNQIEPNVDPGIGSGMLAWDLTVVATGSAIGSNGSDSWSTTLSTRIGEVRLGTSQDFALRSPQLQIEPQDFVDLELIVSVNGLTVTHANALAIAWESQDRPPMPSGGFWWDRDDDSDYAELS